MVQFVPLKVDTASQEYRQLQSKHRSEGNTIPKIFLIRADGTKLYAKSGSLLGDQLPTLMTAAIREMGRPLALKEVKILEDLNTQIEKAIDENDLKKGALLFGKLKKLGTFGQIGSYAKAALDNNALAVKYQEKVKSLIDEYTTALESNDKLVAAIKAIMLKSDVGSLSPFKVSLNELEKKVRSSLESVQLYSDAKNVASAVRRLKQSSSKSQQRAADTIKRFVAKPESESAREYLLDLIPENVADTEPEPAKRMRTWTSSDGKFSVNAVLASFDGKSVRLERESGRIVTVPLEKLSVVDQEFLKSLKK